MYGAQISDWKSCRVDSNRNADDSCLEEEIYTIFVGIKADNGGLWERRLSWERWNWLWGAILVNKREVCNNNPAWYGTSSYKTLCIVSGVLHVPGDVMHAKGV